MKSIRTDPPVLSGNYYTFTRAFRFSDGNCHLVYVTSGAYIIEDSDRFDIYTQGALRFFSEHPAGLAPSASSCTILDVCISTAFIKEYLGDSVSLICDSVTGLFCICPV